MGVALRPEADHGHGFSLEYVKITIFVRINFGRHRRGDY
jgi:hypothetical protein